ncbi:GDP-L-fucose synthase [Campylobacter sp. MIT 12-8780]|uniref:GDP-L-fucose synthase family protein n=1 Tax=Campylobacter sp. MIT 12-8780 TaxID=2202200 RepID=UPI00115F1253|nr:GDP-L-fucose synthase [Campylobacter sp. MIT 12-8780]TQR42415.1 GDP-L-fucose synthase [Campylobacter sp. MIT 12-8780]
MRKESKIFIAGHKGLVGSALLRALQAQGFVNLITKTHDELDLCDQKAVAEFFEKTKPEYVFLAAAKVGGIEANNTFRADFIYENLQIQNNVIHQAYKNKVKKLLFLGSTCIYPKNAPQPISEESLLSSKLEYTNEPYAIAKIAGLKMCESYNFQYGTNFLSVMPTNLYGINDNFDLKSSHVLPALLRKIYLAKLLDEGKNELVLNNLKAKSIDEARAYLANFGVSEKSVEIWGSGKPRREFLYVDDMAEACIFIMQNIDFKDLSSKNSKEIKNTHLNIGTGKDISIKELAELIQNIIGFKGTLIFNTLKPDGTMRKLSDVSKLKNLGWSATTKLEQGIKNIYEWYKLAHGGGRLI